MSNPRHNRGVTLIELMIALSLLAIILASLLAAFDSIHSMSQSSSNLTVATLDAEEVMTEVLQHDYESLLSYAPPAKMNLEEQSITVAITDEFGGAVTTPLPDLVKIAVEVGWKERGTDVRTELSTLRARGF